ncbi:hypothetical protein [Streptomyces xanthii]|uniref:Uncharacterized protein n=1 Tax=Streptomyces xanthii TaxID=2768069 RepID=A0A7H1B985_9ACTN|nr:hypothetical protein [Streptomyces xanthii]QNS05290.1 hypothetical protein IAG42_17900 [Streptomyces xanthii]
MPAPRVAVIAPLTGPRAAWGAVLLRELARVRAVRPGAADWHVHDETPDVAATVVGLGYTAVLGHSDPAITVRARKTYQAAGLPSLLPFVHAGPPALSWAPDDVALASTIVLAAAALGTGLTVVRDDGPYWAALADRVTAEARATGLGPDGVPAVLAPQERFSALRPPTAGPVLALAECGLASFSALRDAAADQDVWAVHPHTCAPRRAWTAATALAQALETALSGPALTTAIRARSAALLAARGGILGEAWRVSRVREVCVPGRSCTR